MIYFLMLHYLADFLLQSRQMAKKKSSEAKWLIGHLLINFGVFWLFGYGYLAAKFNDSAQFIVIYSGILAAMNALAHGLIDWNIWSLYKWSVKNRTKGDQNFDESKWEYWNDNMFYHIIGLDQLLHISVLWYLYSKLTY